MAAVLDRDLSALSQGGLRPQGKLPPAETGNYFIRILKMIWTLFIQNLDDEEVKLVVLRPVGSHLPNRATTDHLVSTTGHFSGKF